MFKKYGIANLILFFFIILAFDVLIINALLRDKFHDVTIELGTESVTIDQFVKSKVYLKKSKFITNIDSIDLTEVKENVIELAYGDKHEKVRLVVLDKTAPEVDFQDLEVGLDYEYNVEDFIIQVRDLSDYQIYGDIESLDIKLGEYKVNVTVSDVYGNKTSRECTLKVKLVHDEIIHELSEVLTKEEILITEKYGSKALTKEVLETVDVNNAGEYDLKLTYEDKEYITKVIVKDTLGPVVTVNNIIFYLGGKEKKYEDFVKKVDDPSGVKDISYDGELNFKDVGVYEIKIIATDNVGNVSETLATLTVKADNVGPVISGLSTITINKGEKIDYLKGVKAIDAKDGNCEVTVDTSKVKVSEYGTYYAVYKSKDLSNNVTTKKRKIVVKYDQEDLERMFNDYFNKYLAGKSVLEMTKYIKSHISYVHSRGSDPLYIAIVNRKGSCYGHAILLKKALDKLGIPNYLIQTKDGTHYWNLVYQNGVWRHYDSTPGSHIVGPATDAQKASSWAMNGRTWDKSAYPAAN